MTDQNITEIRYWFDWDNAERGRWCERCMLPSITRVPLRTGGGSQLGWASYCDSELDKPGDGHFRIAGDAQ